MNFRISEQKNIMKETKYFWDRIGWTSELWKSYGHSEAKIGHSNLKLVCDQINKILPRAFEHFFINKTRKTSLQYQWKLPWC